MHHFALPEHDAEKNNKIVLSASKAGESTLTQRAGVVSVEH
jgi:hypothetical protein